MFEARIAESRKHIANTSIDNVDIVQQEALASTVVDGGDEIVKSSRGLTRSVNTEKVEVKKRWQALLNTALKLNSGGNYYFYRLTI